MVFWGFRALRCYCDFCGKNLRLRNCDCQSLAICDCDCVGHCDTKVLIENTEDFDVDTLMSCMDDTHHLACTMQLGPEQLGWWVARKRLFIVLIAKRSVLASQHSRLDTALIETLFHRARPVSGPKCDMFFCAPPSVLAHEKQRRLTKCRHVAVEVTEEEAGDWLVTLSMGQCDRKTAYETALVRRLGGAAAVQSLLEARASGAQGDYVQRLCEAQNILANALASSHRRLTLKQVCFEMLASSFAISGLWFLSPNPLLSAPGILAIWLCVVHTK